MKKIAKPQELQAELRRLLDYCSGPEKPSRVRLAAELNALADRVAMTDRTAGESLLDYILDRDDVEAISDKLEREDEQSYKLFQEVISKLSRAMKLPSGIDNAFYRVLDFVSRGKNWDIALLRNNVFKAANALGIDLPSGMFA